MAFLNDSVFDNGLSYVTTNGTKIDLCSSEPVNFADIAAITLANDTVITGGSLNATSGRKVIVPAITAGDVTANGTATHYALSNGIGILVATGTLTASQVLTSGNTFTTDALEINLLDAVQV